MSKRVKKFEYADFKNEKNLHKLKTEVRRFLKSRCKLSDDGDLPVGFMLRSRKLHYPFSDVFLIPSNDEEIDRAIELQTSNLSSAMDRLRILFQLKSYATKAKT